ncbi:MAG: hypothetical protein LBO09_00800 [Candidatus Peribacteria bacterium]|nr:hypothetical protein [Candidatus Peribacteria bacterium]
MPTFIREGLWCLFIAVLFLSHIKQWKAYRNRWKRSWISLGGLLIFSVIVSYLGMDKGRGDILIGIKYGFRWLIILLASTGIGFFYREKFKNPKLWKYLLRGLV